MNRAATAVVAALALGFVVILSRFDVAPVPTWFYVFAWYPTLVLFDSAVVLLGGDSLLARPRELFTMLWWSAVIWLVFEGVNFRLQNWYYVFLPASMAERWAGVMLSFATVVPALLLPARLLERLGIGRRLDSPPVTVRPRDLTWAMVIGVGVLLATLAAPRILYPLTWGAVWLIAEPLVYRLNPEQSLFADMARGRWGRIARLMLAGLIAGALWEAYNHGARGKWIYTVPFLEDWKLFEMPPLGFVGFPFFALEAWSLYHLLAAVTRPRAIVVSALFAGLVLAGMDRWTVSSVTPRLAELPGTTPEVRARLARAGWDDVFRLARTPPEEVRARAGLSPAEARDACEAARLSALRGIGTRHAAALYAAGIETVAELAAADPDSVWRRVHQAARPTRAEVRVWVHAARRLRPS